jgi:hypothetical protein
MIGSSAPASIITCVNAVCIIIQCSVLQRSVCQMVHVLVDDKLTLAYFGLQLLRMTIHVYVMFTAVQHANRTICAVRALSECVVDEQCLLGSSLVLVPHCIVPLHSLLSTPNQLRPVFI